MCVSLLTLRIISQQALKQEQEQAVSAQKNTSLLLLAKFGENTLTDDDIVKLNKDTRQNMKNDFQIITKKGKLLYTTNKHLNNTTKIIKLNTIKPNTIVISKIVSNGKEQALYAGSVIGSTDYYFISKQVLHAYPEILAKTTFYFRIILFALMLVLIPLAWFLTSLITKPINQLIQTATDISKGHTNKRFVSEKKDDELSRLTASLNKMSDKLNEDIETIRTAKEQQELFVSSLSHEIKTPLTSIIGYAQMLQWENLEPSAREFADYIVKESFRLKNLSEDVLKLIQSQKNKLAIEAITTAQITEELRAFLSGVQQAFTFEITLPEATILADPNLFKLVAINLLSNALAAIDDDGKITITGQKKEERYFFSFKDNGKGIPEALLEKVTTEFFTADTSRSSGHLGLGLSLVKNSLALHGGELTIISKENVGTTITVDFPLEEEEL
jgi:signal transduction histidine kinase